MSSSAILTSAEVSPYRDERLPFIVAGLLLFGCIAQTAPARPLTLTSNGQATCVIVVPAVPNDGAAFVAKDLQWHFKKVTGADVQILNDREKVPAGLLPIFVGESRGTSQLGLSTRDFREQEYTLKFFNSAIVLMGKDVVEFPVSCRPSRPMKDGRFGNAWHPGWVCATVAEPGFNDDCGTFECFVHQGTGTNDDSTGLTIFSIGDDANGQRLYTGKYDDSNFGLIYESIVNGKRTRAVAKEAWVNGKPGWHHVMCTWDAAAGKQVIYLDGKQEDSVAYTKTQCAPCRSLGLRGGSDGVPYAAGPLDEVRLSRIVRKPVAPTAPYVTDDDTTILMHFDDPSGFPYDSSEQPRTVVHKPERDGKLATLYAVYDFIERYMGVRWYMPGELGMVYDRQPTLVVNGADVQRQPAMIARLCSGISLSEDDDKWGGKMWRLLCAGVTPDDMDMFLYRLREGGPNMCGSHSFYGYARRYKQWKANPQDPALKNYPEDTALFAKGTLMAQGYPEPDQLCYSSPDAVAQVVKDARKYFDEGATKDGANAGPNWFGIVPSDDGWWCKCDQCQAKLKFSGKESANNIPTFGSGLESNASYLVWNFTKQVAEAIQKSNPGKYINQLAYIEYLGVPRDKTGKVLDLPTNIVLGCCLGTRPIIQFDPARNGELAMYKEWMQISKQKHWLECFWLYQCFPSQFGAMQGWIAWPGFHAHNLDKSMRMFINDQVDAIFLCGVAEFIDGWLTFKYMYNPDFNVDTELDEFFTRYYGPAAKPMKEFYLLTEKQFIDPNNYPHQGYRASEAITWSSLGTPPVLEKLHAYILDARKLATDDPYKKRVDVFCDAIWNQMKEGSAAWLAKQPGGRHPWPFRIQGTLETQERGIPYFGRAYFRNNANPVGLWQHGFNDKQGTMEAAVWCGPISTNGNNQGPGTLFEIAPLDLTSGHRVSIQSDPKNTGYIVTYETWANGKTNAISSKPVGTNKWHHIAASWQTATPDGSIMLYIDQTMIGKKPYTQTSCAKAPTFDVAGGIQGMSFGAIDEVRLSKVLRPPNKQTAPWTTDTNTLLLMHFDEGPGEAVKDCSGIPR